MLLLFTCENVVILNIGIVLKVNVFLRVAPMLFGINFANVTVKI